MSGAVPASAGGDRRKRGNRTGWSTGACAAAAAAAAARGLETGVVPETIEILLPEDRRPSFAIIEGRLIESGVQVGSGAQAAVIKDAGDDPDATHGARIVATVVRLADAPGEVHLLGGEGVGRVTRAGLGLTVGEAAINPGPRAYITANVRAAAPTRLSREGLAVTISVPDGERIAKRTLNARLGILGGISILGTTGVVYPYSTASFKATIRQGVQVALAQGQETVVFTTGRRTERHSMTRYPELPEICFVQMGDFVGAALDAAREAGLKRIVIGAMVGKLTKIAQGLKITHARKAEVDMQLLARLVADAGGDPALCARVLEGDTARWAAELVAEAGLTGAFHQALTRAVAALVAQGLAEGTLVEVLAWGPEGDLLAEQTVGTPSRPA
ncbi:MAG: cobalt-precorrin-5B (C(1))-methyltransferase [Thiocapsa sp.]|uniref:cobalt-precorrin-5B (C(1))-methyltransferase n=1 Tax=Thiocapsa sp. TaxID=2024551 RepID=UPI001BCF3FDD|nr:cobalt-precorrin-5B (C(1))-methyltransferase [Thiocapsa sp.]QVL50387.1 MAG: cobalt-precorrin-5B (C(1))-methyltransferase [Thiocapsa sp.]